MKLRWLIYAIRAKREIVLATALLLLFAGVPAVVCEWYLHHPKPSKDGKAKPSKGGNATAAAQAKKPAAPGGNAKPGKKDNATLPAKLATKLLVRLDKQKEQHSQWAYAALTAIVAVSV